MKTPEIVLQIRDGVLEHIATNGEPVKIIIIDWDNIEVGDSSYPNENCSYEPDYEFNDLGKYLEENQPNDLKLYKFFEMNGFRVNEDEISKHTKGGVEMKFILNPFIKEGFQDIVENFDVDEYIDLHRNDPIYKENFTIKQSLNDFEDFHNELKELNLKLNNI